MALSLKTSAHIGSFSLLARAAFLAAQNCDGQKRLDYLDMMVAALECAGMFGEGEIGCAEVGIPVEKVCALRQRAERELFRKDPSRWDLRRGSKPDSNPENN